MRKIYLLVTTLLLSFATYASVFISDNPSADKIMMPLFNSGQTISLAKFVTLTPKEYKSLTGKKMNFKEKISLKIFQRHFKNAINKDGTVNLKKFQEDKDDMFAFRLSWFLLGFFLFWIGLVIALLINDDKKHERIKWTGIGCLTALVLGLLTIILLVAALNRRGV